MGDIDDAELLAPIAYPRGSRATYPFKRQQPDPCSSTGADDASTGRLKVVYDRQFDRFFLREESSPSDLTLPVKSPKPRRVGGRSTAVKKRQLAAGVQWEDLIVPPRSVIKRSEDDISYDYQGLSEDAPNTTVTDKEGAVVEAIPPTTTDQASPLLSSAQPVHGELPGTSQNPPPVEDPVPVQLLNSDKLPEKISPSDRPVEDSPRPPNQLTGESQVSGPEAMPTESPPTEVPAPFTEAPTVGSVPANDCEVPAPALPSEPPMASETQPDPGTQPSSDGSALKTLENDVMSGAVEPTKRLSKDTVQGNAALSKLVSVVRILRFLRRRVRQRRANTAHAAAPVESVAPPEVTAAVEAATQGDDVARVEGAAPSEPVPGAASSVVATNDANTVASTPSVNTVAASARSPSGDSASVPRDDNTPVSPLHLDLSRITSHATSNRRTKSPLRKSPKRKTRALGYAHHLADDNNVATDAPSSTFLRVDNQHEHEIRWQGEVIHVDVEVPASNANGLEYTAPRGYASTQYERRQPMSHVYSLRELARIRPHADGFRRVNEACSFTPLTSSSESSESDDDPQIAVVHVPSSSDDDFDDSVTFQRGDKVLFHARHRWFKGVILKRIKQSWFYDIRAANGTVFEAIQAKRIRLFDGDDEPKYSFEAGDRVLWRPTDTKASSSERRQNYKARVLAIRRYRSSSRSSRDDQKMRYDLELLTGRIVKKVPHDELSPLRQYR